MIVGRHDEVSALRGALEQAVAGRPQRLLVTGDVGMGKTALLDEAASMATERGFGVHRATALPGLQAVPFAMLADLLRRIEADDLTDPDRALLADLDGPERAPTPRVAAALVRLLDAASRHRPLLLLLDDLRWADEDSMAAVTLALGRLQDAPVAAVAAARRSTALDPRLERWERLDLGPLRGPDAVALLHQVLTGDVDDAQAARVVQVLGGCPLAIVECHRLLTDEQISGTHRLPDLVPLDDRLLEAWKGVAAQLPAPTHEALLAVCVLGTPRLDLLEEVLRAGGRRLDDLTPAVEAGLVRWSSTGSPAPSGPLVRAAVLEGMPGAAVRSMHRRAAEAGRRLGLPPAVVTGHLQAAAVPGEEALAWALDDQARRAHHRDQPEVAARAWEAAARVTADPVLRGRWAVDAARTWLSESTSVDGGAELLELLGEVPLRPDDQVWREWLRAEVLTEHDMLESAAAGLLAAEHARSSAPWMVGWLLWGTAAMCWAAGDADTALRAAEALDAWQRRPEARGVPLPAWTGTAVLGTALLQRGDTAAGVALVRQAAAESAAWAPAESTPLPELINVVALDELMLATGPEREARLDELDRRLQDDRGHTVAGITVMRAWRARRRGDWVLARRLLEEGLELARAVRATGQVVTALCLAVDVDAATGDEHLEADVTELTAVAGGRGDRRALVHVSRARGLDALARGQAEEAVALLEPLLGTDVLGRGMADAPLPGRVDLVEALTRAGDVSAAADILASVEPVLRDLDEPTAAAALHRCRVLLAPTSARHACAEEARQAMRAGGDPFEQARTSLVLGEHLRRARCRAEARSDLRRAAVAFDRLGSRVWRQRAEQELRAAGSAARTTTRLTESLGDLTPQERRVAEAVAEGASNREVAEALFLSPRTVEFHLASIYRKLGIPGRTALTRMIAGARLS